jgi:hypothetical protein
MKTVKQILLMQFALSVGGAVAYYLVLDVSFKFILQNHLVFTIAYWIGFTNSKID